MSQMISVIVLNHNGAHLLIDCLQALLDQTFKNYEVIVVDNASIDGSCKLIENNFPQVKLVRLSKNKGFTGGNIEGYKIARGKYIALLNNDTRACNTWIEKLVECMESDQSVGICSSKLIIDGTNKIDTVGDIFTTAFTGTKVGEFEDESKHSLKRYFHGGCAGAIMYRKAMLDKIGFLDEDFFLNHEDTDLNLRAWLSGWKCIFVPEAVVYHKVSATNGIMSDITVYHFSRNTEWVWIKNTPLNLMLRYLPQKFIYEMASFGYFCILQKKWRPFLKGKVDAFAKLFPMLKKRKLVQRSIKLTSAQIKKELMPISQYIKGRLACQNDPNSKPTESIIRL
jgi:GT2 family glycosyltransferase